MNKLTRRSIGLPVLSNISAIRANTNMDVI